MEQNPLVGTPMCSESAWWDIPDYSEVIITHCAISLQLVHLPERENDKSCHHEDKCEYHKHAISSVVPLGIVEYFCTLWDKSRGIIQTHFFVLVTLYTLYFTYNGTSLEMIFYKLHARKTFESVLIDTLHIKAKVKRTAVDLSLC